MRLLSAVTAGIASALVAVGAMAGIDDRDGTWLRGFATPGSITATLAVHRHDGIGGPILAVGGTFDTSDLIGGEEVNHVGRWNGRFIEQLGEGFNNWTTVFTSFPLSPGAEPSLIAGGEFTASGATPMARVASFDGRAWQPMGSGLNGIPRAFAVRDGVDGPTLYVGGRSLIAGQASSGVAMWTGTTWTAVGSLSGEVEALIEFDDGTGPALYAGGSLTSANGTASIQRWTGTQWKVVTPAPNGFVKTFCTFDDGNGNALWVGGSFANIGAQTIQGFARWDGTTWSSPGGGLTGSGQRIVRVLRTYEDLSQDAGALKLFIGGTFPSIGGVPANGAALWNGVAYAGLGTGVSGALSFTGGIYGAVAHDDGTGPALYVCGDFLAAGDVRCGGLARWDTVAWRTVGAHSWIANGTVRSLVVHDDGGGPQLYAAGDFNQVGSSAATTSVPGVGRWDGSQWRPVGTAIASGKGRALASMVGPDGPRLYLGGSVSSEKGKGLFAWDGVEWEPVLLQGEMNGLIRSLCVWDDGTGAALYVAGDFTTVKGIASKGIAKFDGTNWHSLAGGVSSPNGNQVVHTLRVFDPDGDGPAASVLVAGGKFTSAGAVPTSAVAAWDGTQWLGFGPEAAATSYVLAIGWREYDDGSRNLLVGGSINTAALDAIRLAERVGAAWVPMGEGLEDAVTVMDYVDDGSGRTLWIGGEFKTIGGKECKHIARWNGTTFVQLGDGFHDTSPGETVMSIIPFVGIGEAKAIVAGSMFSTGSFPGSIGISNLAGWSPPNAAPEVDPIDIDCRDGHVLSTDVRGSVPIAVQWRRNGRPILDGEGFTGALTSRLTIDATARDPGGTYDLVAASPIGITVIDAVEILVGPTGDLDGDGTVGPTDLGILLGSWDGDDRGDLNCDGTVDGADLLLLLEAWGAP
jgi:hypothetical protein